mmetsp:Transcript_69568/g.220255  ORF Transcript_69568/g.220255 Transcript_69568/m.220255 type:complete len:293 (-) Transcript_69568:230-1108(-)
MTPGAWGMRWAARRLPTPGSELGSPLARGGGRAAPPPAKMPMVDPDIEELPVDVQEELAMFRQRWIGPEDPWRDGWYDDHNQEFEEKDMDKINNTRLAQALFLEESRTHKEILEDMHLSEAGSNPNMYKHIYNTKSLTHNTGVFKQNWKYKTKSPAFEKKQEEQKKKTGKFSYNYREKLETAYTQIAFAKNTWYYRDRMNNARGPCTMTTLREAWSGGVIDGATLVWGQGLDTFIPIHNVRTLTPQIRTWEVKVATWIKKNFVFKPHMQKMQKNPEIAARRKTTSNHWALWE